MHHLALGAAFGDNGNVERTGAFQTVESGRIGEQRLRLNGLHNERLFHRRNLAARVHRHLALADAAVEVELAQLEDKQTILQRQGQGAAANLDVLRQDFADAEREIHVHGLHGR